MGRKDDRQTEANQIGAQRAVGMAVIMFGVVIRVRFGGHRSIPIR